MSNFSVTILGCGSATPTTRHMPSAQAVTYGPRVMLIDCGEGTQLQLRRFGISFAKITDIFISHLHGDHFLGLPGLLSTMSLHGVEGTVTIHVHKEGAALLRHFMDVMCPQLSFELRFDELEPGHTGLILDGKHLTVSTFPLSHRVPCVGFLFREKPKLRHIDGEAAKFYGVPHYAMNSLREGADWVAPDGRTIPNSALTRDASPSVSYAYCSDTAYNPALVPILKGVDVLYHEATYSQSRAAQAAERGHSTALDAARIAAAADVGLLVIGHYSQTETDEEALAAEARMVFPRVVAANEGLVLNLDTPGKEVM